MESKGEKRGNKEESIHGKEQKVKEKEKVSKGKL